MYYGPTTDYERPQDSKAYKQARWDEWVKLRETEQKLFVCVVKAWRKNKTTGRWNQAEEMSDWVTREQIADEMDTFRLIPYYLKLLAHLSGGSSSRDYKALHWVHRAKRTRWRTTYDGRRRPAGYEWVYLPDQDVIAAIKEMDPNNPKPKADPAAKAARPVLPAAPEPKPPLWERAIDSVLNLFGA